MKKILFGVFILVSSVFIMRWYWANTPSRTVTIKDLAITAGRISKVDLIRSRRSAKLEIRVDAKNAPFDISTAMLTPNEVDRILGGRYASIGILKEHSVSPPVIPLTGAQHYPVVTLVVDGREIQTLRGYNEHIEKGHKIAKWLFPLMIIGALWYLYSGIKDWLR